MLKTVINVSTTSSMNLCDGVFPDSLVGERNSNIQVVWPGSATHSAAGPAAGPGIH